MTSLIDNGREAQTYAYNRETMDFLQSVYLYRDTNGLEVRNAGSDKKAHESFVLTIPAQRYRGGDRFVRVSEDLVRRGYTILPSTIRIIEVYEERGGEVRARCVIEEALASVPTKQASFEEASSEERRRILRNSAIAETRKTAKALGGKALSGTPAQKKWAEDIRRQALGIVSREVADKIVTRRELQSSKWWIENREHAKKFDWLAHQVA